MEESVVVRRFTVEVELATKVSLADKKELEGGQRGDRATIELSCCKREGAKLLFVSTTRWLDKHACGDERGNVWGYCM